MLPRSRAVLLWDIYEAAHDIQQATAGKTLVDYLSDRMMRRAVERSFEIIGEALVLARRLPDADSLSLSDARDIIAFRNTLIHGYFAVQDAVVWSIIQDDIPALLHEVSALMKGHPGVPPLR